MNREYWKNWLEGTGIVAIVASLIFVGLQLRQADDIAFAELSEATAMRGIEMSALIADHADVWRKACLGEELSSAEHIIAANIFFVISRETLTPGRVIGRLGWVHLIRVFS